MTRPERLDAQHDSERARLAGQRERPPAERDDEGRVADLRDRLAGPEEPEVAVPERLENARRGTAGGHWLHRGEAILRVCRTGSPRRVRADDESGRQGGEPRDGRAPRRAGRCNRRRRRRSAGEVERDRRRCACYHATAEPLDGGESVAAMSEWARTHGITLVGGSIAERREGARSSRTRASSSIPTASCVATSTARSTSSTSRSAASSTASRRRRSRATEPVVVRGRGLDRSG